ncbi:MAG: hypothetical protein ACKO0N_03615 [Planctomycetota bacterium]
MKTTLERLRLFAAVCGLLILPGVLYAQAIVPGTGTEIKEVGDDFEDPDWTWNPNLPKVFNHEDTALSVNGPLGTSSNGRWYEGKKRGQPDSVRRVETPAGGLAGSTGAMAIRSQNTGGSSPSFQMQQDDLIGSVADRIGKLSVAQAPNVVTRVFIPPLDQWENRTGCHFAFRVALETSYAGQGPRGGLFRRAAWDDEEGLYWPGFFLNREIKKDQTGKVVSDRAFFWMKATQNSRQIDGPFVEQFGWWTLGMSVSPDGQVHYYAKPGIEDLTAADRIASAFPFGHHAYLFRNYFFNVCSGDDGRTWSTEFIIDDTKVYRAR